MLGLGYFEGDSKGLLNLDDEMFDYLARIEKPHTCADIPVVIILGAVPCERL